MRCEGECPDNWMWLEFGNEGRSVGRDREWDNGRSER